LRLVSAKEVRTKPRKSGKIGLWRTERDLSKALNVSSIEAKQAVAAMQLQGYTEPIGRTQKWRTTEEGVTVSGAKTARFTREAVEQALSALHDRIQAINSDPNAEYAVSEAVGFWRLSVRSSTGPGC
jgi:hypothetical protein